MQFYSVTRNGINLDITLSGKAQAQKYIRFNAACAGTWTRNKTGWKFKEFNGNYFEFKKTEVLK